MGIQQRPKPAKQHPRVYETPLSRVRHLHHQQLQQSINDNEENFYSSTMPNGAFQANRMKLPSAGRVRI